MYLFDYQQLSMLKIADSWAKESGYPIIDFLFAMGKCATHEKNGETSNRLYITPNGYHFGKDESIHNLDIERAWNWWINDDYQSPLFVIKSCENPPTNWPSSHIKIDTFDAILVNKEDFRVWCIEAGYDLPRFWFGGEKRLIKSMPNEKQKALSETHKRARADAMTIEISDIVKEIASSTTETVWRELVKRAKDKQGCLLPIEETAKGPVIPWRAAQGQIKRLSKKALGERLRR